MARGPMDRRNHGSTPHARAMAGGPSIQIVVLLSLTLQVVLLVFAGIRRREAHPVRRTLLYSAYLLVDYTAIYALGHYLYFSSVPVPHEHRLVTFWAPFLLIHLGGPDNISAYALQDNQLRLRHLQNLNVQVLGAAYVLYKHIASNGTLVLLAAILIFAVGVAKYAERTWALWCGSMGGIRSSLKKESRTKYHFYIEDEPPQGGFKGKKADEEEFHVRRAHSLFHICKYAIVNSSADMTIDEHDVETFKRIRNEGNLAVIALIEIELSLLYDILYTKAAVIHSLFGYFIRAASPLAIAASLLLFHFSGKDGHSRVDVAITYVLLAGAFFLEMTSLLSALGSSWTLAFLCTTRWSWIRHAVLCSGRWCRLRRVVVSLHHFVNITGISIYLRLSRRCSRTMGQYNMLHRCTGSDSLTSPLFGRLARKHYSGTVPIPEDVKERVFAHIERIIRKGKVNTLGMIRSNWGNKTLDDSGLSKDLRKSIRVGSSRLDEVLSYSLGADLQEAIIIWHIGTDVFLARSSGAEAEDAAPRVKAIRELSNYMMFLLVERPNMLPGLAQTRLYNRTYYSLVDEWRKAGEHTIRGPSRRNFCTMLKELFRLHDYPSSTSRLLQRERFARMLLENKPPFSTNNSRLRRAILLAEGLLILETAQYNFYSLGLVLEMWTDFLVYAANRCSRESHAKKLNSGGEFTTVIWLMAEHFNEVSLAEAQLNDPEA